MLKMNKFFINSIKLTKAGQKITLLCKYEIKNTERDTRQETKAWKSLIIRQKLES